MSEDTAQDAIDWRSVTDRLRAGQAVDLPCATDRECTRRTKQIERRSGQQGFAIRISRESGRIHVESQGATEAAPETLGVRRRASQEKRRAQRGGRRGARGAAGDAE